MPSRGRKPADPSPSQRDPHAEIDHGRALQDDEAARHRDPHGHSVANAANEDEPSASPSSDRHRSETATGRIKGERAR